MLLSLLLLGCPKQANEPTALTADEFALARWINELRRASNLQWLACLDELPAATALADGPWTTCLLPVLSVDGELLEQNITESSGVPALDACADEALRSAFPARPPASVPVDDEGRPLALNFCYTVKMGELGVDYQP